MFVITNKNNEHEFWSNEHGWVGIEAADYFTAEEKQRLNLPVGGVFVELWRVNCLQFARLIAEAEAAGVWDKDSEQYQAMLDSMDLEANEVDQIIERAQGVFDDSKANIAKKRQACPGKITTGTAKASLWPDPGDGTCWIPSDEEEDELFKINGVSEIGSEGASAYHIIVAAASPKKLPKVIERVTKAAMRVIRKHARKKQERVE